MGNLVIAFFLGVFFANGLDNLKKADDMRKRRARRRRAIKRVEGGN